jgi:hypothetical protein
VKKKKDPESKVAVLSAAVPEKEGCAVGFVHHLFGLHLQVSRYFPHLEMLKCLLSVRPWESVRLPSGCMLQNKEKYSNRK